MTFKRDQALTAQETAESAKLRPILAAVAWHMFCDRPLWGCGFGQYPERSIEYLSDRSIDLPLEKARPFVQHNVLLALLTETGLAGMGLFVVLLGTWLVRRVAALAVFGNAAVGPAAGAVVSGFRRQLPVGRHVPGRIEDPHDPHVAVLRCGPDRRTTA